MSKFSLPSLALLDLLAILVILVILALLDLPEKIPYRVFSRFHGGHIVNSHPLRPLLSLTMLALAVGLMVINLFLHPRLPEQKPETADAATNPPAATETLPPAPPPLPGWCRTPPDVWTVVEDGHDGWIGACSVSCSELRHPVMTLRCDAAAGFVLLLAHSDGGEWNHAMSVRRTTEQPLADALE
jgi:hypothetical protein